MNNRHFKQYQLRKYVNARPYIKGEDLTKVYVNPKDEPETDLGYIVNSSDFPDYYFYVRKAYFEEHYSSTANEERKPSIGQRELTAYLSGDYHLPLTPCTTCGTYPLLSIKAEEAGQDQPWVTGNNNVTITIHTCKCSWINWDQLIAESWKKFNT